MIIEFFSGTPIRRLGYNRFMRNVLIAVANSKNLSLIDDILIKLDSENELMELWLFGHYSV